MHKLWIPFSLIMGLASFASGKIIALLFYHMAFDTAVNLLFFIALFGISLCGFLPLVIAKLTTNTFRNIYLNYFLFSCELFLITGNLICLMVIILHTYQGQSMPLIFFHFVLVMVGVSMGSFLLAVNLDSFIREISGLLGISQLFVAGLFAFIGILGCCNVYKVIDSSVHALV